METERDITDIAEELIHAYRGRQLPEPFEYFTKGVKIIVKRE